MDSISRALFKPDKLIQAVKLIPIGIVIVFLLLNALSFLTADKRELINIFDDDAYYYFKIAHNFRQTGQITFDGLTTTNGFHPLWLAVLIPFFFSINDPILVLRAIGIFSTLLCGVLVFVSLRHLFVFPLLTYFLSSSLLLFSIISFGITGMEVTLVMPLIIIALSGLLHFRIWQTSPSTSLRLVTLGLVLSLIQLTRLDAIWLILIVVGYIFVLSESKEKIKNTIFVSLFPFLVGSAYLLINYSVFRHLIPTSGVAKSLAHNTFALNRRFLDQLITPNSLVDGNLWVLYLCLLVFSIGYLLLIAYKRLKESKPLLNSNDHLPIIVALFLVIFSAFQIFRTSWALWRWYAYPMVPIIVFLVPELVSRMESQLHKFDLTRVSIKIIYFVIFPLLIAQLMFLSIKFGYWTKPRGEFLPFENYLLAETLNQEGYDLKVFAVGDRAGSFAYFYHGNVLQLEGLVGDYELLNALRSNRLENYMNDFGVEYVMTFVAPGSGYSQWNLSTPLPWLSSGPYADINLCKKTEVRRIVTDNSINTIWSWPSCDVN